MEPKSLQEAILYFSDPKNCREYMVARRWPDGVTCPRCGSKNVIFLEKYNRWHCREKHSAPQFTLKTGTIFEDSPIGLDKWLTAMWLIVNSKNGVSSWEIHRALKVTQKTAWFMLHRIRLALQDQQVGKLGGPDSEIECDETFVGQKSQNMHKSRKLRFHQLRNQYQDKNTPMSSRYYGKTAVMGMLDREQRKVRATVVPNTKRETLQSIIFNEIEHGSKLYTDQMVSYDKLAQKYAHEVVNHLEGYVQGRVHTNGMENFWSLLKRSLHGSYVAVEPFHLFRYVDEQVFRYNNRATKDNPLNDSDRFDLAVRQIVGKRITYKELTGKEDAAF
ncbi:MAG TPA: IS1595 family transposase [Terriglobales bacterium]